MTTAPSLRRLALAVSIACLAGCMGEEAERSGGAGDELAAAPVDDYLERYFATFPTRATAAGRHDFDHQLERLDAATRGEWLAYNRAVAGSVAQARRRLDLDFDEGLDLELLERQARRQILAFEDDSGPRHRPLFWSGVLSNATVFLLVRDDRPAAERMAAAVARAEQIPRLAATAREALASGDPAEIPPEHTRMAAGQTAAAARYYREGFAAAAPDEATGERMRAAGEPAAAALEDFSGWLEELAGRASGSFRLGERYAERFRHVTGIAEPVNEVAAAAETALAAKRREAAEFGREVWSRHLEGAPPADDTELLRRLFERVAEDRPASAEELVADYRRLIEESKRFVVERGVVTLPEPLALWVGRSPSYFLGQSVGGVYAAGPYASEEAETLLFLPTPSRQADAERQEAFFRDFNDHFNRMITPHEVIPGHYYQLVRAARHPRKVRALFGDGVYIEGWGTFAERLMLDLGWGDDLDRLAHLKKQLENIARTIVDIRVHTAGWDRDRVELLVRDEALQEAQFAGNMWRRTMTSSPQLTFYFLGYREVWGLYEEVREHRGAEFDLAVFTEAMMEMGPVPVRHYRARLLGDGAPPER